MERFVALKDRRLRGDVPVTPQLATLSVDATVPLAEAFTAIIDTAGTEHVRALFLLCASSRKFVGDPRRLGKVSEPMKQGDFSMFVALETVRHFGGHSGLVVEALDGAHGEGAASAKPVEQRLSMLS